MPCPEELSISDTRTKSISLVVAVPVPAHSQPALPALWGRSNIASGVTLISENGSGNSSVMNKLLIRSILAVTLLMIVGYFL
jgi:hypothetical protein